MSWSLTVGLDEIACQGLLVLAESSGDPDLAPFVGQVHVGASFLIVEGEAAHFGFLTAMERDEAAASGLDLLTPKELDVDGARSRHGNSSRFWTEILRTGLARSGLAPCSLALAGRLPVGLAHGALEDLQREGWRFVDGRSLILRHRKSKSGDQVQAIREAAVGVCAAFRRVAEVLAEADGRAKLSRSGHPLTARALRREVAVTLAEHGLDQPEGNIVAAGSAAAVPHTKGADDRVLEAGETIVVDLFPKGSMFADCTRTFCVGGASSAARGALDLVRETLAAAHRRARIGCRLWDLQEETCRAFAAAGFATPISAPGSTRGYVHGLGHGVGFELHEYPSFARAAGDEGLLEVGDVFTLEPGLYDPEAGYGVRLEDLCLATADGIENLTPLPYDADPRAW